MTQHLRDWGWSREESLMYHDMSRTAQDHMDIYRGVGSTVVRGMSLEGQLRLAGLNWQVMESDFCYGDEYQFQSGNYRKAIYRSDTGMLLDTVGDRWTPHQNTEIIGTFNEFCTQAGIEIEHIGCLREGRAVFAVARTDQSFDLGGDEVYGKILLTGFHEQGKGHRVDLMTLRKICGNGLTVPVRLNGKVISHVGEWNHDYVMGILEAAKTNFRSFNQQSERLAQTTITVEEATLHLIQAFGIPGKTIDEQPKTVQTCLRLFQGQARGSELMSAYNTAWGLLNSVTEYFNHHSRNSAAQTHLNSLWMGGKAQQQQRFMQQLVGVYLG